MSEIGKIELVFLLLLLFVVLFGLVARKFTLPYPIVMVAGGLILGLIPGIPAITLNPDLIFLVILPPLLYAAAWTTSWRDFRHNFISIFLLAFGLVGFTVFGVAAIAPMVFDGFDWGLGLVLGAVVAPTDAIAASAIARRVGLPGRIVDILEGESLINDATGLLALQFAVAMVVSRQVPTVSTGVVTLAWLLFGGIILGLAVGWLVDFVERHIDDGPIEITISILIPYFVYLTAESAHASGMLAVVTCGLFLGRRNSHLFSPSVRIQIWSFWESFTFVLNGLVFVLIGLQLPAIRAAIGRASLPTLLWQGMALSALLIFLRLAWTFPGSGLSHFLRTRLAGQNEAAPGTRQVFIVGWTGMRGVVSLAAALALPTNLSDGTPFPHRSLIVFLTFCVIVVTLVLQGITLPPLIRALGLNGDPGTTFEERDARRVVIGAAVAHLEHDKRKVSRAAAELYDDLIKRYRRRLASARANYGNRKEAADHQRYVELSREASEVERQTAVRLRNEGRINDEVLRRIERELDLTESRFVIDDN